MPDTENLYGENAVVGSKEDALEGRDIQIQTSNTKIVNLKTESTGENTDADKDDTTGGDNDQTDENVDTPEGKLEKDIQNQMQAEEDAKKDLQAKGVDFDAIAGEYETNGQLSADTLKKLADAGYPKSVVDAYIAGMEATAQRFEQTVYDYAGGKDGFNRITQFVTAQGQAAVNTFNKVLGTGDLAQIKLAIQGFQAQIGSKYGTNNRTIVGSGNKGTGVQGFASRQEMVTAMSDPRYGRDPKYTQEVQAKTMKASFM